tara:strand:+ start:2615 stop:2875 length:261 start_codon:yes stop_codon:yes gene_type:complete
MKNFIRVSLRFCLLLFIVFCFSLNPVDARQMFITSDVDLEINQKLLDSKSIDDLLGPDTNFPFDPANHRDGSNPIKRIGKISDDNL